MQKILKQGGVLNQFIDYIKYPRSMHLPWSQSLNKDDRVLSNVKHFEGKRVIVTVKMDGECLDGESLISLSNNSKKKLKDINIGDEVSSFNNETNEIEKNLVINKFENEKECEWYEIQLEDGSIIKLTENHKVYLPKLDIYREAKYLTLDDEFLLEN